MHRFKRLPPSAPTYRVWCDISWLQIFLCKLYPSDYTCFSLLIHISTFSASHGLTCSLLLENCNQRHLSWQNSICSRNEVILLLQQALKNGWQLLEPVFVSCRCSGLILRCGSVFSLGDPLTHCWEGPACPFQRWDLRVFCSADWSWLKLHAFAHHLQESISYLTEVEHVNKRSPYYF